MPIDISKLLPRPGPLWGAYPLRAPDDNAPPWRRPRLKNLGRSPLRRAQRIARLASADADDWRARAVDTRPAALAFLRRRLRNEGMTSKATAQALGFASACAEETLSVIPRETQLLAAAILLDQRLAEMATGEGKTLALALAAAVAALAGMPVHLVTANDYLAARDAALLAPLYAALGLSVTALPAKETPGSNDEARRAAYQHDIVYATARDLAFDFLRDRLMQATQFDAGSEPTHPPQPLMRGLCMALLDEADSILLDEADVPLILSREVLPQADRRAFLWQALTIARQLASGHDFTVHASERNVTLTPAGMTRIALLTDSLKGPWKQPRDRQEAITVALIGLHACRRNEHYVVRNDAIELLDEITGRVAQGRVWSRGLHTIVALKEGLRPPNDTDTMAQITFQRFFQRYWRIGGMSGTLFEARRELQAVLGTTVVRIPLDLPCRRKHLPPRRFNNAESRWAEVCKQAARLQTAGRPVLIGTDSVADSLALSKKLRAAGITHRVLNALQDTNEAAIIAEAGRSGQITVATRMAGRGTDIKLDTAARAAGGLHVLSCQNNPSYRVDRQLAGRAGRHGDPGSSELWLLRHDKTNQQGESATGTHEIPNAHVSWVICANTYGLGGLSLLAHRWTQRREEQRRSALRNELLRQDIAWERRLSFAGPSR